MGGSRIEYKWAAEDRGRGVQDIVFVSSTQTKYSDIFTIINWIDIVRQMGVLRYSHEIREYIWDSFVL